MKFNRRNIYHWLYLLAGTTTILISLLFRPLKFFRTKPLVILYGHKLNGNLSAYYDYLESQGSKVPIEFAYLTMDPAYFRAGKKKGLKMLVTHNLFHMIKVAQADVLITDHGYHMLVIYLALTSMKFVDVWHGVPFKGYPAKNFESYKKYAGVWVSSKTLRNIYVNRFLVNPDIVKVTGYGRTDPIVNATYSKEAILKKYELPSKYDQIVLLAPAWKQDDSGRSIIPFGTDLKQFFRGLNSLGKKLNSLIIFRAHLNSSESTDIKSLTNLRIMPYAKYPIGEEFLFITDVLVSDWSSIVFDFLPLRRPTIFLDVPAPFKDGFTVDKKYRFGDIVSSFRELMESIERALQQPTTFKTKYSKIMNDTDRVIYGGMADGRACQRYQKELLKIVNGKY